MTIKRTLILLALAIISAVLTCGFLLETIEQKDFEQKIFELGDNSKSPSSLQMYNLIEKKSKEFDIPKYILYNVAWLETRYCGPFDWSYNPYRTSGAGAQGPMQIITRFAHYYAGRTVTAKELRTDLELNITISCSMLSKLYKRYGRWDIALGYYNTGYPQVNDYASYGFNNKDYKVKWIEPDF